VGRLYASHRAADYRAPYGQWIGYTKQITKAFDRAGERAWQVDAIFDFKSIGLPGLSLIGSATWATARSTRPTASQ